MELTITGPIWSWRGPAPYLFVTVPPDEAELISEVSSAVTYGWGMIPCAVQIGATTVTTSLWPKDGSYVVPIKKALQTAESVGEDDVVTVVVSIQV